MEVTLVNLDKNKIHVTTDYGKFTYLIGNRDIVMKHVKDLSNQIESRDLTIPIIVNEKMEVCDGQHRLEAYRVLGMPVHYIIKEGLTLTDIRKLNSVNRKWTMQEYLMSHVKLDSKDYITLEWFVRAYGFSVTDALAMLNGKGYVTQFDYQNFKNGKFVVHDLEKGKTIAQSIIKIGEYFEHYRKKSFIHAMISVMNEPEFVWSIFEQRLKNYSAKLTNQGSRNDFILNIEKLYNYKTSPDRRIRLKIYGG
tara:strand:+ start:183 stop:935 length:753 start_codon:yes stop_codon:yes gene_type:complete